MKHIFHTKNTSNHQNSHRKKYLAILITLMVVFMASSPYLTVEIITEEDGIWNPDPQYQRYRVEEYSLSDPFYQWWYFSLKDYQENVTYAFCYTLNHPYENLTYEGAYVMFAMVSPTIRGHIYYQFPLDDVSVSEYYNLNIANSRFQLNVINENEYQIQGNMLESNSFWVSEGLAENSSISWDLNISRIVGWYGQQDIEFGCKEFSIISWNTYAYDSLVSGTITINGTQIEIEKSPRFRMYCDMNWGENFPNGDPAVEYPWGWFYTGMPATNPEDDFSIIAGIGRSSSSKFFTGDMHAKFASLYLNNEKIGIRSGNLFDNSPDKGWRIFHTATKGDCQEFRVDRSDWIEYIDIFGRAQLPLTQVVTIETTFLKIVMEYKSIPENYNRLLFPSDGYCFSDFEALGANCTTHYYTKTFGSSDVLHLHPIYNLQTTYFDNNAGLEFGYAIQLTP